MHDVRIENCNMFSYTVHLASYQLSLPMKTLFRLLSILILYLLCSTFTYAAVDSLSFDSFEDKMESELGKVKIQYELQISDLRIQLNETKLSLSNTALSTEMRLNFLLQKMNLEEEIEVLTTLYDLNLERVRYDKGIELIKMMYEKILGLDHHFTSLETYQSIMQMSNPNAYPEYQKSQEILQQKLKKDFAVRLPNLLVSNPYVSATYSLVAALVGDDEPRRKEEDLEKVACILDFTVRMNADLSIIYYETEYLKESNRTLKEECILLFDQYTRVVGYNVPLDKCRKTDDWETLEDKLEIYIKDLEAAAATKDEALFEKVHKGVVNIEFSIDRMLDFLNKYSAFIGQGEKYYQKFQVIVSNYQNETACAGKLPHQFSKLKQDINFSIEKFNEAYNIAELKGSRLKDLLYGLDD